MKGNTFYGISRYKMKQKALNVGTLIFKYIFLTAIAYVLIYPLIFMISASLKAENQFNNPLVTWIPKEISLEGYKLALRCLDYGKAIVSTLKYEIVSAFLEVGVCAITAYGLARYRFKLKPFLMVMLILTIIVPEQMTIVPKVVSYSDFDFLGIINLINTIFGTRLKINILNTGFCFWLPSLFSVGLRSGFMIFIYIQFFKGLPKELEEAAWIDGANPIRTFIRIIIPSSTVVIFTVTIFSVIWHYNDYYLAVMYINKNFPLAVSLFQIKTTLTTLGYWSYEGLPMSAVMAACTIFVLPMLLMYIILQRKFVKSIDSIGITG